MCDHSYNRDTSSIIHLAWFCEDANNINGTLPSGLSAITDLKVFSMLMGNLHGTIPEALGELSNLEFLQLADQALTGSRP
jgi:hypothetical protein